MPALTLDIKTPNTLEKMALRTAKALDQMSKRETVVNKQLDKLVKTGKLSDAVAKKARETMSKNKKGLIDQQAKLMVMDKKSLDNGKKEITMTRRLADSYLMVKDAVMVAWRAAKSMTIDMFNKGKAAANAQADALYEINQWSGFKGVDQLKEIDKWARESGIKIEEARQAWLKFRQASTQQRVIGNQDAMDMMKFWGDIRAISKSTAQADKQMDAWIEKINEGPAAASRFQKQLAELTKFGKIGSGDVAKALKNSMAGADDQLENALGDFEKKIFGKFEGVVAKMKTMFSGWLTKLTNSKMFDNFLTGMRDTAQWLIDNLPKLGDTIADFVKKWNEEGGKATDWIGDKAGRLLDLINPMKIIEDLQKGPPKPTAPPAKSGALSPKSDRQLAGITIQNLNVEGGGSDAEQIARSVRQELQMLLQAGALSKGYA
jgi:hypothetical protein